MRFQTMYCIKGNDDLSSLVEEDDNLDLFMEPFIVKSPEGSCRDPWKSEDYLRRAKIFYLMRMYDEYSHNKEFDSFFPSNGLDEEFFDKYWYIFQIEDDDEMPAYGEKFTGTGKLKRSNVKPTGSQLIDNWLNSTVDF